MLLDFLLSPITDKNTFTGGVVDNYCGIKESRRLRSDRAMREEIDLKRREVEALEKIANAK